VCVCVYESFDRKTRKFFPRPETNTFIEIFVYSLEEEQKAANYVRPERFGTCACVCVYKSNPRRPRTRDGTPEVNFYFRIRVRLR